MSQTAESDSEEGLLEKRRYEEVAYVLDFLPQGKRFGRNFRAGPIVQMVGEEFFTLLEATVNPNVTVEHQEKLYIGKERRDKVDHILGRVSFQELTPIARSELSSVIELIVRKNEAQFLEFFNRAQPVTPRMHAFELLPGIGKKYMWQIVNERAKKPFVSYDDIKKRTELHDPAKYLVERILEELQTEQKYRIFTRPL